MQPPSPIAVVVHQGRFGLPPQVFGWVTDRSPAHLAVRDRVCMVTGGNGGIGFEIAQALAAEGAHVVIVARDEARGRAAIARIQRESPQARVELELADLSLQSSVRALAERTLARGRPLHVLVNNAGIALFRRAVTAEGIERIWATNVLGYHLLTTLLEPLLRSSAPARVVTVASGSASDLDLTDVEFQRRKYDVVKAYAQSKQANRVWAHGLARRLAGSGVTSNAMNPGQTATEAFKKAGGILAWVAHGYISVVAKPARDGADTAIWLAGSTDVDGVAGRYFENRREVECPFKDPAAEDALWAVCDAMTARRPR